MDSSSGHSRTQITVNDSRTSLIGSESSNKPIGIRIFGSCFQFKSQENRRIFHKALVLLMTFIAYASFHMGRRPVSIIKNELHKNCSIKIYGDIIDVNEDESAMLNKNCSWPPFDDDKTANQRLAYLDTAFLTAYALCMFGSGILAERMNLRYFITFGSIISGIGLIAFGLARSLKIHSMVYFLTVQLFSGAAQSIAWPVVVTCVDNWIEPASRGIIYGLWNSHTNLGNILGATISGFFVETDWGLSSIVPGIIMIGVGILLFLFLVPTPQDVDIKPISNESNSSTLKTAQSVTTISSYNQYDDGRQSERNISKINHDERKAVSFMTALRIPGVIEYSLCLFFSKLVSYTFLYWLPKYIKDSSNYNSEESAYMSNAFDIGGIGGAILAGFLSDRYKASGLTCNVMLILAIPSMFVYKEYGVDNLTYNILLLTLVGALVNGPYCLITTAVSADLGNQLTDGRAMATVSAIIDGMGSIGAVVGPQFAGIFSRPQNYEPVFNMLMLSNVLAALCLIRVTTHEIKKKLSDTPTINSSPA